MIIRILNSIICIWPCFLNFNEYKPILRIGDWVFSPIQVKKLVNWPWGNKILTTETY